ncbi:hypothetical protein M9H77_07060 [Catharanthus roseus]|uniref:Uncharacterized protein n=1 Tax=Catharanthus roseus TaxID=4058 RepID=A0ACC0BU14_CATRO|nr:hypothetical protein M9H77_07060 [Catharanthus roseus]
MVQVLYWNSRIKNEAAEGRGRVDKYKGSFLYVSDYKKGAFVVLADAVIKGAFELDFCLEKFCLRGEEKVGTKLKIDKQGVKAMMMLPLSMKITHGWSNLIRILAGQS